jgi:hypothetical protein
MTSMIPRRWRQESTVGGPRRVAYEVTRSNIALPDLAALPKHSP